jgi:hypothetical protein
VIYLLIAIKAVQVCLGPFYDYLDGRWLGHALRKSERKRLELRASDLASAGEEQSVDGHVSPTDTGTPPSLPGWRPSKVASRIVGAELACAIVVAWVVSPVLLYHLLTLTFEQIYIVYSIGT